MFAVICKYQHSIQKNSQNWTNTGKMQWNMQKKEGKKSRTVCTSFIASRNHNMSIHPHTLASPRFLIADMITNSTAATISSMTDGVIGATEIKSILHWQTSKHICYPYRHPSDSTETGKKYRTFLTLASQLLSHSTVKIRKISHWKKNVYPNRKKVLS